jgi:class 3 adenylate cyclase/predicted ATPase
MNQNPQRVLVHYLSPNQQEYVALHGDLPPQERTALAIELRETLQAYARYIPGQLVQQQLANPIAGKVYGAFWDGSLLFADLSGFTALSAELSELGKQGAEEVSGVVNRLFNALVAEVLAHHGALLKFGGDALTAFFDNAMLGHTHAAAATMAALAMQRRMEEFSALKTRKGTFRLQLRVGVHSGRVFAAQVGDVSHIELVVTGAEVNRVATAQEIAAPGEVVISDYTAALLDSAVVTPRESGFQHIVEMPPADLPDISPDLFSLDRSDDIATLETLACQVESLRPYLMRGLPKRFLDASVFEMGEFRPVSVLFVHFHDFSALLELLADDATGAAHILNAYFQRAQAVVHRYDGIVNKVDMYSHGDKLMILFGAPTAHEDDPQRAVRCALELQETLKAANAEIHDMLTKKGIQDERGVFYQRVGINTGTVFAGRVGGVKRYEYTVMGSAVNLSARLMSATDDGTILLSPETSHAVERQFALAKQPPLKLKGLPKPVEPFRVERALDVERLSVGQTSQISRAPLVGRDALLAQLKQESAVALNGTMRVLALVGEAGIGKSRLAEELIQSLVLSSFAPDGIEVPDFQMYTNDCQSYEQSIPYAALRKPIRHLLRVTTHSNRGQSVTEQSEIITRLEEIVKEYAPSMIRFTPLLGDVLGIGLPFTPLLESMSDEQRHDRLQDLVVEIVLSAARQEPLLLSLEDIQWADASSLEIIERLTKEVLPAPLLPLLNYRPEPPIVEPWMEQETNIRVELGELSTDDSEQLLAGMLGGSPPPEVLPLLERTQGNPFFIEELVRALITSDALARDEAGHWHMTRPLDQISIPTSIEGLIYARLDRLDEQQLELVQVASVIGRRFSQTIVAGIVGDSVPVDQVLHYLIAFELIAPEDTEQDTDITFIFRHALLRDVAYEGILYARRRNLHYRVADQLEQVSAGGYRDELLPLLAQHYLLAEAWGYAFYYHKRAACQAQRRYANREALALFATALDVATHIQTEQGEEDNGAETYCLIVPVAFEVAEIHERSGYIQALLGEGETAQQSYQEALRLVREERNKLDTQASKTLLGQRLVLAEVRLYRHLAALDEQHGNYQSAFDWLEQAMVLGTSGGAAAMEELSRCYLLGARIYFTQGDFTHSREWAQMALKLASKLDNITDQANAFLRIGVISYEQGDFAEAVPAQQEACRLFEQSNVLSRYNDALNNLGVTYDRMGRWDDAVQCYERSLEISENIGDALALARTANNLALVLMAQGELERASSLFEYSCSQFSRIGSVQGIAYTTLNRGEVLLLQERPEDALTLFYESIEILERINARLDIPEVLRLAAEALLALGQVDQAHDYATRSLEIARELGMAVEEATALRALGQVAFHAGDHATANSYLEQSQVALEQLGERYELGKVVFCQAQVAFAVQHPRAPELLCEAERIFQELDAQRDLQKVQAFAAAVGGGGG